jgi:dTMP kinase
MFIVVDGTDGSGKATQTSILLEKLKKTGHETAFFDFPQYGQKSAALVEEYLNGKFGPASQVGPYRASIFYACDRYAASFGIRELLAKGTIVVSNRYASSNMGHQTANLPEKADRDSFLAWLDNLEFEIFGIPRPDVVVLLYVPPEVGQNLVAKKAARSYLEGGKKRDLLEDDISHLRKASEAYLYVAKKYGWKVIDCTKDGKLRSIEEISELLWQAVEPLLPKVPKAPKD